MLGCWVAATIFGLNSAACSQTMLKELLSVAKCIVLHNFFCCLQDTNTRLMLGY